MTRGLVVLAAALLLAVQVVRNAAVAAFAEGSPDNAARIWGSHPDAQIALAMTDIGRAARDRKPVPAQVFASIDQAATKAPLAPEPFLVRGVQAQLAGDNALATRAFRAAEYRDPRSLPAHYFLADQYFRTGDARRGLIEAAALARLAPGGVASMAPYVAAYAKDRRTWPQLREIFSSNSDLESASLFALAGDPRNADTVMALADEQHRTPAIAWVPGLLNNLVQAGQYAKARDIWAHVSRAQIPPGQTLYDAAFSDRNAPPPFNWELLSSGVGLAERQQGGRLHVIFYGQQDGILARQLLLLAPGRYRMTMAASGGPGGSKALNWSIRCDRQQSPFSAISLTAVASAPWIFSVPVGCPAQWLELSGVSSDVGQQSDFTIGRLSLVREAAND
jgi:hypothetical protein